ncbi:MAG: VOC family protein [Phyllobacterium sp.]|uniref:VOC family protein n=1 Tax=Phyllobacterium sp. TaxID=1871046 RepID=UPI0030F36621
MSQSNIHTVTFGRVAPGLPVKDIQAACAFYCEVLGFQKVFENGSPTGFMVLKKDAAEIHLNQVRNPVATTTNALHMFVDDIATLYEICEAKGVRIIKSLKDKDYGQRAFVFADPDGNRIDVGQRI